MMSRLQSVRCCHLEGEPKRNRPWTAARLLTALAVALAPLVPAAAQETSGRTAGPTIATNLGRLTRLNRLCGALLVFVATLLLPTARAKTTRRSRSQ